MEDLVKQDECLDDLQNGYMLIQKNKTFKFGVDAVLLADFAEIKRSEHVLEMGTGTGIIPILLHAKKQPASITALEIQEDMADMARRSVKYNKLEDIISILHMDLKEAPKKLGKAKYDCVVTNPPYVKREAGINNPEETKAIARFEIACTLQDVVSTAKELLQSGGKLFMVHRADRLVDIIYEMRNQGIEPKRIRFVHSNTGKRPHLILIEGTRGGRPELKFMDPLYIYDDKGEYTEEIHRIYGRIK
ncbi:MAG TPA: tRNA1(Val) (adenine(37)-N6)-methyltransferase [Patescibacteria group bacterium]|nr:tRNA1(Val) (adenine(37)-N6)-methyltransferase [Patescibacteria group bacterium]